MSSERLFDRLRCRAATLCINSRILEAFLVASILLLVCVKLTSEVVAGDTMVLDRMPMQALRDPLNPRSF